MEETHHCTSFFISTFEIDIETFFEVANNKEK
jgi:hypothetical protein